MQKLRKQIKESFFNPVLHLLPLLIFLVVDDFFGMNWGWEISLPISLGLLFYVYFVYNRIFTWHLIFTAFYIVVSLIAWLETILPVELVKKDLIYEIVILFGLFVFLIFRKQIQKLITGIISYLIPMTNNFNELYRVIWALFIVLFVYVSAFLIVDSTIKNDSFICFLSFCMFYKLYHRISNNIK